MGWDVSCQVLPILPTANWKQVLQPLWLIVMGAYLQFWQGDPTATPPSLLPRLFFKRGKRPPSAQARATTDVEISPLWHSESHMGTGRQDRRF